MLQTVLVQVIILFILILLGVILNKTKILNDGAIKGMTDMVLYFVTPAAIINSFIREYSSKLLKNLGIGLIATIAAHILFIIIASLLIRSKKLERQKVLQFGVIFSNCGYMSLPLLDAVLGSDGVFYGATYIAVFQLVTWSYGVFLMGDGLKSVTPKKVLLSPGIIGFVIAVLIFVCRIPMPEVVKTPISYMASLNTPLPMIIIGFHLANSNVLSGLRDIKLLFATFLKLAVCPMLVVLLLYVCGLRGTMPLALSICASAPTAAITTMFAAKFGKDTGLSVTMVSLTTLLSVVSMPLVVTFAEKLLG